MAPLNLFQRLSDYYHSRIKKDVPTLTPGAAAGLSILFTLSYVLPFYFSAKTRPSPNLTRDAPSVIRARTRAVTLSCTLCSLLTFYLAVSRGHLTVRETLHLLGWWPFHPVDLARSFLLIVLLFLGPLFEALIVEGEWRDWLKLRPLVSALSSPTGFRNYVVGPLTEELLFRAVLIPLHILTLPLPHYPRTPYTHPLPFPPTTPSPLPTLIFLTPLYFGLAHLHHLYELRLTNPSLPLFPHAVARVTLQFAYTALFGSYAAFLFLRTASLPACVVAHSFANAMGLPRVWGRVGADVATPAERTPGKTRHADVDVDVAIGPPTPPSPLPASISDGETPPHLAWSVAYYVLLVLGAVLFYRNLWTLTASDARLVEFGH